MPMRAAMLCFLSMLLWPSVQAGDAARSVRFVAFGDAGVGVPTQHAAARAIAQVCAARGCDFALMLGDNIYPSGVGSATDPQFEEKFELPFAPLAMPVWAVLGNHDNGGGGAGHENRRGKFQVDYHYRRDRASDMWRMPARYYRWSVPAQSDEPPLAEFFALDSNPLASIWPDPDPAYEPLAYGAAQRAWLAKALGASRARWKIAFAHHPYRSNGMHGNAGSFGGKRPPAAQTARGAPWKEFVERGICAQGGVDLLFAGHDHDLQWLKPVDGCGRTQFVVSGALVTPRDLADSNSAAWWQQGGRTGFFWFELREDSLTGAAYLLQGEAQAALPRDAQGTPVAAFEQRLSRGDKPGPLP